MDSITLRSNVQIEYGDDLVWFNGLGTGWEIIVNGKMVSTHTDLNRGIIEFTRWLAIIGFIVTDTDFVVRN